MASQTTKILDVTKSYVPVDPNAFPETYHATDKEDSPEQRKESVFYEGYNFLPTSYGYKSYFGIDSILDIGTLTSNVDDLFIIQTNQFINIAVALCEDGIWTKQADSLGVWTQVAILPIPAVGTHYDWSKCVIGDNIFCHRQGDTGYFRLSSSQEFPSLGEIEGALPTIINPLIPHPANTFYKITPNFLNMAGQQGIFKAGSRLGFWDSENSTAWSSLDDFADFVPAVITLAGSVIFQEVSGRIVNILASGDGYVIYSTKSITLIQRSQDDTFGWSPKVLLKNAGIAFRKESCASASDTEQFSYTTLGLFRIDKTQGEIIVTGVTDFLKESNQPVFLRVLEGRYLFLEILDNTYINGLVSFTENIVQQPSYNFATTNYNEVLALYNGEVQAQQEEAARIRAALRLPATTTKYFPVWSVYQNNIQIVKPLSEGLPIVAAVTLTPAQAEIAFNIEAYRVSTAPSKQMTYLPDGTVPFILTYTSFPLTKPKYTGNHIVNAGGVGPPYPTASTSPSAVVATNVSIPNGNFLIQDGLDLSALLPSATTENWSLSDITNNQIAVWAARDAEVIQMVAYAAIYSDSAIVGYRHGDTRTARGGNPGDYIYEKTEAHPYPHIDGVAFQNYKPECGVMKYNTPDIQFNLQHHTVTIDSGWTPLVVSYADNKILFNRRRGFVTGITPRITISEENVTVFSITDNLYTSDGLGNNVLVNTITGQLIDSDTQVDVTIATTALNTDIIVNPTQEGYAELVGYRYTDVNNNQQFLPINTNINLSYRAKPVPPLYVPPISFLLQNGSIGPVYPTIPGALVYDLQLKKWGKMKQDYKVLVDYSPINNNAGSIVPYEVFGLQGGAFLPSGTIALFNENPLDSYIKIGKIGYWRQGVTSAEEIHVHFRSPSSGRIELETSLDGVVVELGLHREVDFNAKLKASLYPSVTGKWHNIVVVGQYDIKHIEYRGTIVGNR